MPYQMQDFQPHEFRTPLTLILGPAQRLKSKAKDPSDKEEISIVLKNAQRLKAMINQLLSLSKLESGKMKLNSSEEDLIEFIKTYIQSFESLAIQKNVTLSFSSNEKRLKAFIDKEKFVLVINNILTNAFKFIGEGGEVKVAVTVADGGPEKQTTTNSDSLVSEYVGIEISDTGSGIHPENLGHIFDRFYQVDDSITREKEGTGIGLAIAKEMVILHYGNIDVISKPGEGSTFTIYLPLGKAHLKPDEILDRSEIEININDEDISEPGYSQPDKIEMKDTTQILTDEDENQAILLIVEDNSDMRSFIRGHFKENYKIIESVDGQEGLELASKHIPDIIISDVMMPRMDGYQFCERIKTDERTSHIPVILLTALAGKANRMEGLETGVDDFITKPFDGEELQIRVKNLIDQRQKLCKYYRKDIEFNHQTLGEQVLTMDEAFLRKAKLTVEENLSTDDYGVENLASDMALSRSQLHRKLHALLDQSTTDFIRSIRLYKATVLLQQKVGTVTDIAYMCGFSNPGYFSKSFKKRYGISPREYLNQSENS